ncbi:MAG: glutamate 5-kinase, partial [Desulfobulbaceae bacterium]|nr:glutamate 5-kinase [Desulfobulbaceae bacterium]
VSGQFGVGAPVECRTISNRVIATGLTNYSSGDIKKIKGRKSSEIEDILGFCDSDEIIHRDNLVLLDTENLQDSQES